MGKKLHTYEGRLIYGDLAQYQLISPTGATNISEILDKIYYSDDNKIHIKIMNGCKVLFNEESNLLMKPDQSGLYGYHVNGECLESVLFYNTNENLFVEISADALEGLRNTAYEQQNTK